MSAAQAATSSNALVLGPLAPFLLVAFGVDRATVGLSVSALYAGTAVLSIAAGWLNDRFGVRRTLAAGQILLGLAILAATRAESFAPFLLSLFLAGLPYSAIAPATAKALVDWFPARERGTAMAVKQTGFTLGGIAAASVAPTVALAAGWSTALGLTGVLPLVAGFLVLLAYRDRRGAPVILAPGTAVQEASRNIGAVLMDPILVAIALAALLLGTQQSALLAYTALFFHEAIALDVVAAGGLVAVMQASGTVSRLVFGFLSDRQFLHRRAHLLVISAGIGAVGSTMLAILQPSVPAALAVLAVLVAGFGGFGWSSLLMTVSAEQAGRGREALGVGMCTTLTYLGFVVGPPFFGILSSAWSFRGAWLLTAGLLLLSTLPIFSARRANQRRLAGSVA